MEKMIIRLEVPAISEHFDVFVTSNINTGKLVNLLCIVVEDVSDHRFAPSGNETLCFERGKQVLRVDEPLSKYQICNGDCLYLI